MANVNFVRGDTTKINNTPITDGQVLFDTDKKNILMDNGNTRENYGQAVASNIEYDNSSSSIASTNVQDAIDELNIEDGNLDDKIDDLGVEVDNLDVSLTQTKQIVSDEWLNTKTYSVGSYCIFNNILWKCKVQHSGQEPSEGAYWTKVNVGEELRAIRYENIGNVKTVQIGTFNTTSQLQYFGFGNYTFENGWVPLFATVQGSVCIYPNSYQHDNAILKDVYIMDARVGGANADGTWFQNQLRVYRSAAGFYGGAPVYMTFLKVR